MTDEVANAAAADAVQPSQIIHDTGTDPNAQGRGVASPEVDKQQEPAKLSTRDAIAKAFDDAEAKSKADANEKAKGAVEDAKAKVAEAEKTEKAEPAKPQKARGEDGKFAKAEKTDDQAAQADKSAAEKPATGQEGQDRRQSEGRQHSEPPARFLPEARTKWANVPNEVKAEFHRVSQEMEGEIAKHRQASERYEPIRQFDEIAKSNGRELKDSLAKVVEIEQALARNPIAGLDAVLREIGPRKQDGSPLTLMDVARHIVQNPQAYQQAQQPQIKQAVPQESSQVSALAKEIHELKAQIATQSIAPTIERFAASHPDYHELEPRIVEVLNSGVIDKLYGAGLSPEQKLTEAYRMAGGNPLSRSEPEQFQQHSEVEPKARPVDPDGQKSIKGAPTAGQTGQPQWKPKTNREALERAFASVR